jgi:predicted DNA-binding transcriptional regulator AlpA
MPTKKKPNGIRRGKQKNKPKTHMVTRPWPTDSGALVTLRQINDHRLPVARTTLFRWADSDLLPRPIRIGKTLWWRAGDVDAALERLRQAS